MCSVCWYCCWFLLSLSLDGIGGTVGQSCWNQESKHREPMGFCAPCFFPWVPSALHVVEH